MRRHLPTAVRLLLTGLLAGLLATAALVTPATTALAQDGPTTTTQPADTPDIIPEPNSGSEPEDAGDRGGWLQTGLFVLVVAAVVLIGYLIVRESRKARENRGF